jgi:hypothetical protein
VTIHEGYAVLVNYSDEIQDAGISWNREVAPQWIYGDPAQMQPFDAAIVKW